MDKKIVSWKFKDRPTKEEYESAIHSLKEQLKEQNGISDLDKHKILMVEDPNTRHIYMWISADDKGGA